MECVRTWLGRSATIGTCRTKFYAFPRKTKDATKGKHTGDDIGDIGGAQREGDGVAGLVRSSIDHNGHVALRLAALLARLGRERDRDAGRVGRRLDGLRAGRGDAARPAEK